MNTKSGGTVSIDEAEAALGAMLDSETTSGSCGGPWRHELTPVVKYCGVSGRTSDPVLLVNPTWLRELVARRDLAVLADEINTWFAIQSEVADIGASRTTGRVHDRTA